MEQLKMVFVYPILMFTTLYLYQTLMRRIYRLPPGPFKIPLLGNLVQIMLADPKHYKALYKLSRKYGNIMTSDFGVVSAVTINGYEAIKSVYNNENFLNRMDQDWFLHRSFGKKIGLGSGTTDLWNPTRQFTMKYLREFGFGKRNVQQSLLEQGILDLSQDIDEAIAESGGILEPCSIFKIPVLNAIWVSATNTRFSNKDPSITKLLDLMSTYVENMAIFEGPGAAYPCLAKWFPQFISLKKMFEIDDEIHAFLREMVDRAQKQHDDMEEPTCFLEGFLTRIKQEKIKEDSDGKQIFNEETLLTVLYDLFMGGGHTVPEAMRFALFWLTLYPEFQTKIRQEIEKISGNNEFVPVEHKRRLPYTQAFILETLRRGVLIPLFPRKVYKDTPLDKFVIPANTTVILNLYSAVMDEDFWGDPQNFRPSRFLDEHNNIINSERVLIFGAVRKYRKHPCIGSNATDSLRILFWPISHLANVTALAGHPYPVNYVKTGTLIQLAKFGIRVKKL